MESKLELPDPSLGEIIGQINNDVCQYVIEIEQCKMIEEREHLAKSLSQNLIDHMTLAISILKDRPDKLSNYFKTRNYKLLRFELMSLRYDSSHVEVNFANYGKREIVNKLKSDLDSLIVKGVRFIDGTPE